MKETQLERKSLQYLTHYKINKNNGKGDTFMTSNFKEKVDEMTDLIVSCWDSNQECDENGKPLDGLTFDERLAKKRQELRGQDKVLMNEIMNSEMMDDALE